MSNIANAVKILWTRNQAALEAAGFVLEDFADKTVAQFNKILQDVDAPADTATATTTTATTTVQQDPDRDDHTTTVKEYMGIEYKEDTYGKGQNRRTYRNAKAFEGAAYANISFPIGGKNLKIAGVNLQDFSDNDTRRGRAALLRLLKEHGIDKCGKVKFSVELNVAELMEGSDDAFMAELETYNFED